MDDTISIIGICLGTLLVSTHLASLYYQRKMKTFSNNTNNLIQQIAALEFFVKQQDSRLSETHHIALRMENILKAVVESSCDDDDCKHMHSVLSEFEHTKERNDRIIGRLRIRENH